ncbi:helix-turn-helix transcriptional regulator [Paraburkholderia sp. EG287A]|uniref:helix-turn-helix transcriptional regulator n=1 Tax=unclassified Paraburkholderia TaxID=2615204 RepID=UPI0034D24326
MSKKYAEQAGYVRRLCSLGCDPRVIIPQVTEVLRKIADAEWGMFFYADEHFGLSDVYSENQAVLDVMPVYFAHVHNTSNQEVLGVDFTSAMRRGRGYVNSLQYDKALLGSVLYGELWCPTGIRHSLELTASDGRRGWGSLQLARPPGSRPFTDRNHADIEPFARHIAHAISCPKQMSSLDADSPTTALAVTDGKGKILLRTAEASRLLCLACGSSTFRRPDSQLPECVAPLLNVFNHLWRGAPVPPAVTEHRNSSGRFVFRAYRFDVNESFKRGLSVAVYIEHYAPLEFESEKRGFELGLSERQREICAHLLLGRSHREIGRLLNVRESTVVDHVRKMYYKLDVHNHDELTHVLRGRRQ